MSRVLCTSIRELCGADHHGDVAIIAAWTRNKTPQSIMEWLDQADTAIYVAELDGVIAGVGGFAFSGEITLNYVAPRYRFCGLSRAMLVHLELRLAERGVHTAQLCSTITARRFYRACGWSDFGDPDGMHKVADYPMRKILSISGKG